MSSSGHLVLLRRLLPEAAAGADALTFDVLLHLATLAAVVIVWYRDLFPLIPAFFRVIGKLFRGRSGLGTLDRNEKTAVLLTIASLPLLAAPLLADRIEALGDCPKIVGALLILNGILLLASERLPEGLVTETEASPRSALAVGACQLIALFPGLSRSGSTIAGGRLCAFSREFAVRFSFLLSVPAILGAVLSRIPKLADSPLPASALPACACGMAAAAVTGLIAIRLLTLLFRKSGFRVFGWYCLAVGAAAVIWG